MNYFAGVIFAQKSIHQKNRSQKSAKPPSKRGPTKRCTGRESSRFPLLQPTAVAPVNFIVGPLPITRSWRVVGKGLAWQSAKQASTSSPSRAARAPCHHHLVITGGSKRLPNNALHRTRTQAVPVVALRGRLPAVRGPHLRAGELSRWAALEHEALEVAEGRQ